MQEMKKLTKEQLDEIRQSLTRSEYGGIKKSGNIDVRNLLAHISALEAEYQSKRDAEVAAAVEQACRIIEERFSRFKNIHVKAELDKCIADILSRITANASKSLDEEKRKARLEEAIFIAHNRIDLPAHISDLRAAADGRMAETQPAASEPGKGK